MREQPDFTNEVRDALVQAYDYGGGQVDCIEGRRCSSENYNGVEYKIYGTWLPIRPIIDTIAEEEDFAIENISLVDESTAENEQEAHINLFIADLRQEQPHPAFTEATY